MKRNIWAGAAVGFVALVIYMNYGDIKRYLKMSMM
jgi:hypothetical protein